MRAPLSAVQIEALRRSHGHKGFGYFLDMGLGKTLLALREFETSDIDRLVVICPNSFKGGWIDEIDKHGFNFAHCVVEASKMRATQIFARMKEHTRKPVLIVNFEAVRLPKILDLIEEFITQGHSSMLVVDESIALKNPQSKRTKAILSIAPLFDRIRCLTGKPQTQGPHDLWGQLRLCGNKDGRNFYSFRNRFCRMGGWQGREIIGSINEDELQRIMEPITFVARKEDWLEGLPAKSYTTRRYELGAALTTHYNEMRDQFMTWLRERTSQVSVEIAITKYIKLAQIQCGFIIEEEGGPAVSLIADGDNPRLRQLLDILDETTGKVAICFKHRYVGQQLFYLLSARQLLPAILAGGMDAGTIAFNKKRFNDNPKCRVILLQIQASKFGHTLLGDQGDDDLACNTMIFYENSYSLDDRSQIEDRIHRRGQTRACLYVDLVGTELDADVIAALQRKEGMYQAVMGNL